MGNGIKTRTSGIDMVRETERVWERQRGEGWGRQNHGGVPRLIRADFSVGLCWLWWVTEPGDNTNTHINNSVYHVVNTHFRSHVNVACFTSRLCVRAAFMGGGGCLWVFFVTQNTSNSVTQQKVIHAKGCHGSDIIFTQHTMKKTGGEHDEMKG